MRKGAAAGMRSRGRAGFSLLELLAAVVILLILAAVALPSLRRARESAQEAGCLQNLRGVMGGIALYAADHDGYLPYQMSPDTGEDWSGQLEEYVAVESFRCPGDSQGRRLAGPKRSYAVNSAEYTFLGDGYQSPWPRVRTDLPAKLVLVPPWILLVGENHGVSPSTPAEQSGAVVGVAEMEGLGGAPSKVHRWETGGHYGFADGHAEFLAAEALEAYRADTDYGGATGDPWKWK